MYDTQDGYSQYKEMDLAARTAAASPLELVLVLFSGLMDGTRQKPRENRRYERKAQSINKCIDILNALTSSLEFETGGELVVEFVPAPAYDHCVYRLYEASGELSLEKIDEVILILTNLRTGWEGLSAKLG